MENKRSSTVRNTMSRRRHRSMVTIGVAVVVLALIGTCTIVSLCLNLTGRVLDNTTQKRKLEHFIQPVIMFDPLTFESPEKADPLMLLRSSVWSALLSKERSQLARDDFGSVVLPKSDVDVQAAKLFGNEVKLQHQTFGNEYEMNYYIYNAEKEAYEIQLNAEMSVYTAKILSIAHKGDLYTLEVGFIPPGNLWNTDAEGNVYEPDPDKIMLLEMKKVKDGYTILALKDGPDTQARPQDGTQPSGGQMPPAVSSDMPGDEPVSASGAPGGGTLPEQAKDLLGSESSASVVEILPPVFGAPTASSTMDPEGKETYDPENAADGDPETTWFSADQTGAKDEWLTFRAASDQTVNGIQMTNGTWKSEALYTQNNRITKVLLTFSDGSTREEALTDGAFEKRCVITFDEPVVTASVQITILETEKGSRFNDTGISEITFF